MPSLIPTISHGAQTTVEIMEVPHRPIGLSGVPTFSTIRPFLPGEEDKNVLREALYAIVL